MKTYYDIALRDLKSAKIMLDADVYNNAVRFCQQYVEKVFKYKIELSGTEDGDFALLQSHRVQKLARRCEQLMEAKFEKDELVFFSTLTDYYFDTNYPSDEYVDVEEEVADQIYKQTLKFKDKYEEMLTE